VRINSAFSGAVGTVLVDGTTMNGSTFIGVNLEGSAPRMALYLTSSHNVFVGCRFESTVPGGIHLTPTASGNIILGGFGIRSPDSQAEGRTGKIILDEGDSNLIIGGRGAKFEAAPAWDGDALVLRGGSGADVLLRGEDHSNKVYARLSARGILSLYRSPGDSVSGGSIHPVLELDPSRGGLSTGALDGSSAPTALIVAEDARRSDLKKVLQASDGGKYSSAIVETSGATPDLARAGNVIGLRQPEATRVTGFVNGAVGQTLIVLARDGNSTIQNSTGLRLSGSGNWTMRAGDSLTLVLDSGSMWREISRSTAQ
jgi:hypothetical protein